jgi:hypothetical protein
MVPVDDEVFLYYGGYARGHKVERFKERQIGFARLPRDRFVARDAGPEGGVLRTPLLRIDASQLLINANVVGELQARVYDEHGLPIEGFESTDGEPLRGDSLKHQLHWNRPLTDLRHRPIQLEFTARDARLYGFELVL